MHFFEGGSGKGRHFFYKWATTNFPQLFLSSWFRDDLLAAPVLLMNPVIYHSHVGYACVCVCVFACEYLRVGMRVCVPVYICIWIRACVCMLVKVPSTSVILYRQVLASELTAGYDSFSNLQLYRINGIPILNLNHLCHLLDKLTLPHTGAIARAKVAEIDSSLGGASSRPDEDIELSVTKPSDEPTESGKLECLSLTDREKESYTSFDALTEPVVEDRENNTDVMHSLEMSHIVNQEDRLYSEFTNQTQNLYYGAGDDPLLLDCTNFIHFELDKDKVIVFNIASAYTKSMEILTSYAISSPRSQDLPPQEY